MDLWGNKTVLLKEICVHRRTIHYVLNIKCILIHIVFSHIVQQDEELKIVLKLCMTALLSQNINRLEKAIFLAVLSGAAPSVASLLRSSHLILAYPRKAPGVPVCCTPSSHITAAP